MKPPYFPQLDSIRFLAFLLIFVHHTNQSSLPVVSTIQRIGWLGVEIFLCLSAFLLTRLLLLELQFYGEISIYRFYMRRLLRIWPLYFGYILFILLIVMSMINIENDSFRFITLATFTDNIATAAYGYNPLLATSHLWTISYEEQFYLFLPFVVLLVARLNIRSSLLWLGSLIVVGLLLRAYFMTGNEADYQPTVWVLPITHFESIIAGILLGTYYEYLRSKWQLFVPSAVISLTLLLILPLSDTNYYHVLILYFNAALFSFSLIGLAISETPKYMNWLLIQRPLRYLGKISYGLYVFHLLSLIVVYHFSPFENNFADSLLALGLCTLVAAISYEFFEKYFLELKGRYGLKNLNDQRK